MLRNSLWVVAGIGTVLSGLLATSLFVSRQTLPTQADLFIFACLFGLLFLLFSTVSLGLSTRIDGQPLYDMAEGSYPVDMIKITDKNVRVVISTGKSGQDEKTRFYQFPVGSFNGEIIPDAKFLEVTVSGNKGQFKKLHLTKTKTASGVLETDGRTGRVISES